MKKLHAAILLACLLAAVGLLRGFLSHPRALWVELEHDRNAHYGYGLDMAVAVEHLQPYQFFNQLQKGVVWPPLHGLLVMVTQLLSGNDWRLAVLPSLAGWVLTLVCTWYTAQKISPHPPGTKSATIAGGLVALLFAALSPGGRAYATDVMLESLGAGLTMLVLASHARAAEDPRSAPRWRTLALALTLLFFEKYNYWIIVTAALLIANAPPLAAALRTRLRAIHWKSAALAQFTEPLHWLLLAAIALVIFLFKRGPAPLHIFGHDIFTYPPDNFITIAYAVFFLRIARGLRWRIWKPADTRLRMLWAWHLLPVAISFLLPKRLSYFLWFLSPANSTPAAVRPLAMRAAYYWGVFATDYSVAPWAAWLAVALALVLALALACIALIRPRAFGPGAYAVLACAIIGATLDILHPNNESRFMHSWLPALWTAAGAGAAILLEKIKAPLRVPIAAVCITALAAAGGNAARALPPPPLHIDANSDLDMSDQWLAQVEGCRTVAFFSTQSCRSFIAWTFLNKRGLREEFEWPLCQQANTPEQLTPAFNTWLATTRADAIVFLDVPPQSQLYVPWLDQTPLRRQMTDLMASQSKFHLQAKLTFPAQACTVTIWRAAGK